MEPKSPLFRALTRERKAKSLEKIDSVVSSFSITEKALFFVCLIVFSTGVLSIVGKISDSFSVNVPRKGGVLVEGIVGTPRFINPLLAVSDADRDLSELVYSGLLKETPSGEFIPDLAETYTISPDGLTYSFVLKKEAKWSDGKPVLADDVIFTIQKAQDPALKSPRFVNWQGVTVEKTGEREIVFHLKQPYTPFINNLTLGILPSGLWKNLTSDQIPFSSLNLNAIGSGPYVIGAIKRSSDGIPTDITLKANPTHISGEPYITTIIIRTYGNDEALVKALKQGEIESASNLSPTSAESLGDNAKITSASLTRIFAIFFNQNQNELLARKEIREALELVIDKESLIETVLLGHGKVIDGPLPYPAIKSEVLATSTATTTDSFSDATKMLNKAGWKKNSETGIFERVTGKGKNVATTTLALSLSTANIPELVLAVKRVEEIWKAFGVKVDVRIFEPADLNQSVIRPRKYDALLFGLVTGKSSDLYPFWHSSQRNDPGLNIALYTNRTADKLLENMRLATSSDAIETSYEKLKTEIMKDTPAIFLWTPDFIYALPEKLHGVELGKITTSADRLLGIEKWYVDTDHVWSIFDRKSK